MKKRAIARGLAGILLLLSVTACEYAERDSASQGEKGAGTEFENDSASLKREVSLFGLGPGEGSIEDYSQNETIQRLEDR